MTTAARCLDPICLDGPTDDEPRPRLAVEGDRLCRRCATLLEQRLAELPAHCSALRSILGGQQSVRGENRPTKGSPPIPLNLAAHDHLTLVHATVVSWVRLVCDERDLRGPDRNDVHVLSGWLLSQLPWLLAHDAAGDLADEMRDLTRTAAGMTRTREEWHQLEVACPDCNATDMGRWDGDSQVHCRACGRSWHEDDYPRMVLVLTTDTRHSVTADEAVERARINPVLFRQWVKRYGIRKLGTAYGVTRYSAEDLDRVIAEREEGAA